MLLRRSVVLVTTLAATLAVSGSAGGAIAPDPAPPKAVELESATPQAARLTKTDAQLAAARELGEQASAPAEARRLTAAAAPSTAAADDQAAAAAAATSAGSSFTPTTPVRVLDTRSGIGVPAGALGAGQIVTLDLSSRVPAEATAVVLNVTGVLPTVGTYLTVWPADQGRPVASNLNLAVRETRSNAVTVALGEGSVNVYNNAGSTNVVADLAGYYAPGTGSRFTSVAPTRFLDTRSAGGPLGPGAIRTISLAGRVPATATAVTFNLTGVQPTSGTYVTAWPTGQTQPNASTLNIAAGTVTPNLVTVALGTNRSVNLFNLAGNTNLIADLAGYYATDRGGSFYQLTPLRAIDTRQIDPLPGGWTYTINLAGLLPASASAVVFNLTGTRGTAGTYLTAYPSGGAVPTASNLNLERAQTSANLVTVALGTGRQVDIFNLAGEIDFLMDVAGYFAPAPAACTADCVHSWGDNGIALLGVGTLGGTSDQPGRIDGLSGVASVAAGDLNGYALRSDGRVFSWGFDDFDGLGVGLGGGMSTVPVQLNLTGITRIASGVHAAYGVDTAGRVWAWGDNFNGALGDGTMTLRGTPVQVSGLTGAVEVAGTFDTGYALKSDGTVWVWGTNGGSFGNGSYGTGCDQSPVGAGCRALTPVQVPGLTDVVSISANGNGTFAVKSDGTVWAWGFNSTGQLGLGTFGGEACGSDVFAPDCLVLSPTRIPGLTGVAEVADGGGLTTYAVLTDGTVMSWGFNGAGQLGNGTTGDCTTLDGPDCVQPAPAPVTGLTGVTGVAAGWSHAVAVRSDGTVAAWGLNDVGQISGQDAWSDVPVTVAGLSGVSAVGASSWTSFAVS